MIKGVAFEIGSYPALFGWAQCDYSRQLFWLGQKDETGGGQFEA